jgi:FkbM family methyltransferase
VLASGQKLGYPSRRMPDFPADTVLLPPLAGSVLCDGDYGVFEGSPDDQVVLREYATCGTWARGLVSLVVDRLFGEGPGTFIDIGANIGLVSVPVLERTGSIGIAFEPEPHNVALLERNLARHGLSSRCEVHAAACYSRPGQLSLALSTTNLGDHRLQPEHGAPLARSVVSVPAVRLDDVLRNRDLPHPIVMKLDTQGSEVKVLEGAVETLARADHLISEFWPEGIVAQGDRASRFEALMREHFDFGAVLHVQPLPEPLNSSEHVFSQLDWIDQDGSDPGFFDLFFSKHWVLPCSTPDLVHLKKLWLAELAENAEKARRSS